MAYKNSVSTTGDTVSNGIAALTTLGSLGLSVHPERCVRLRNRHASCQRCAEACTSGALSVEEGVWRLHPELCVRCGTCATVCPTGALEARQPNDADLVRASLASAAACGGTVVFACHQALEHVPAGTAGRVAPVVCLSRIDEALLFELLSKGAHYFVGVHGECAICPRKQGCVSVELVAQTAQRVAAVWGIDLDYTRTDKMPECAIAGLGRGHDLAGNGKDPFDRYIVREHHDLGAGESLVLSHEGHVEARFVPVHVQKNGTLPHFVPSRRLRLLDSLGRLGDPVEGQLDTRLWGHITIDFEKCKSCKMCAVFCPTGALSKFIDEAGITGIEHYPAECVHCGLCQDICPGHAITSSTCVPVGHLSQGTTERYPMADPDWYAGPTQILQRMRGKIGGNSVEHSY